jgi:hypothetical protein
VVERFFVADWQEFSRYRQRLRFRTIGHDTLAPTSALNGSSTRMDTSVVVTGLASVGGAPNRPPSNSAICTTPGAPK